MRKIPRKKIITTNSFRIQPVSVVILILLYVIYVRYDSIPISIVFIMLNTKKIQIRRRKQQTKNHIEYEKEYKFKSKGIL